jgi:hypothetical protein
MHKYDGKVLESWGTLSVRYLNEDAWYWHTEEEHEEGYGVFDNDELIFSSCDEYEARVHYECELLGYYQYSQDKPPKLLYIHEGRIPKMLAKAAKDLDEMLGCKSETSPELMASFNAKLAALENK